MLEGTLIKINETIKKESLLSANQIVLLDKFLVTYKKDDYIYPGALIAKLKIESLLAYKVLRKLEKAKFIRKSFEIYCCDCGEFQGKIYDYFSEIPDKMYCNQCLKRLDPIDDVIIIYKVIED